MTSIAQNRADDQRESSAPRGSPGGGGRVRDEYYRLLKEWLDALLCLISADSLWTSPGFQIPDLRPE